MRNNSADRCVASSWPSPAVTGPGRPNRSQAQVFQGGRQRQSLELLQLLCCQEAAHLLTAPTAEAGGAECRRVKPEPRCSCTHGPSCKVRACMTGTPETDVLSVRDLSVWVCSPSTARGWFPTNRQLNKKPRLREGHGRPGWLAPHPGFGPRPPAPQAPVAGPGRSSASGPASATSY